MNKIKRTTATQQQPVFPSPPMNPIPPRTTTSISVQAVEPLAYSSSGTPVSILLRYRLLGTGHEHSLIEQQVQRKPKSRSTNNQHHDIDMDN